ncbi:MAG: hypothetical protein E3J86_05620 [Candidatus Thorarchaeota archaeon]|nr:MAG: hypothetical protein E3J86_05620 [Candidatus Thorarchaeota archaeon]
MDHNITLQDWCAESGLGLVKFDVDAEYAVLNQILEAVRKEGPGILIHSKPIRHEKSSPDIKLVDAAGHALTAQTALRGRISELENETVIDNPADIHGFLSHFKRMKKSLTDAKWWIWWSPSDLVAQEVDDKEIVRCLRVIARDFTDSPFLVLVAKDVHTKQGLATLEYVAERTLEVERHQNGKRVAYHWQLLKHPSMSREWIEIAP